VAILHLPDTMLAIVLTAVIAEKVEGWDQSLKAMLANVASDSRQTHRREAAC
jgi:hypothetical protein